MSDIKKFNELGDYEFSCGNYSAAYDYFKSSIEIDAGNAYAWYKRSLCASKLENFNEFHAGMQKALSIADKNLSYDIQKSLLDGHVEACSRLIELYTDKCKNLGYGPAAEVGKADCEMDIVSNSIDLTNINYQLLQLLSEDKIRIEDAVELAMKITGSIENLQNLNTTIFGEFSKIWKHDFNSRIVPKYNNVCAWINYISKSNPLLNISRKTGINASFV